MTRRRAKPTEEIARLFRLFGAIDIVARMRLCATAEDQIAAFNAAKDEAKIYHRRLAMEHHPDRGGDGERLKEINAAWTALSKVTVRPRPMRKSALSVTEVRGPAHTSVFVGYTSTSSDTSTGGSIYADMLDAMRSMGLK